MQSPTANPEPPSSRLAVALALATGAFVSASAWISDDALVTFRTVENFVAGDGMRWNLADRTQTATHPLWVLLLSAARWCTGELYYTTIVISILLVMLATFLLVKSASTSKRAVAIVAVGTLASPSFIEFGTCGLENALVYALLAAFALVWFRPDSCARTLQRLCVLGGLLALARQDLVLLLAPCLLVALRALWLQGVGYKALLCALLPGAALTLAWYLFALVYFGTAIPTPGYSKVMALDLPLSVIGKQGLWYLQDLLMRDPACALVLFGCLLAGMTRRALFVAPALGVLLQILYTLRVGGDFMSGRFFTAAFVLSLAVVAQGYRKRLPQVLSSALLVALLIALLVPLFSNGLPSWLGGLQVPKAANIEHGIGNERAYYVQSLGLWSEARALPPYGVFGVPFADRVRKPVILITAAGIPGYLFGANAHLVEPFLCDPLLVRLPLADLREWRVGHFKRRIPEGYLETLATGENQIRNQDLALYWSALAVLLRAPIWSAERWRVWWGFQSGAYDALLERYVDSDYRSPPCVEVRQSELRAGEPNQHWYDGHGIVVREGGLRIALDAPRAVAKLRLLIDGGGVGALHFRRNGQVVESSEFEVVPDLNQGARWSEFLVPETARYFDAVDFVPRAAAGTAEEHAVMPLPICAVLAVEVGN
ncbi:MAG: hypothetical protein EXS02_14620 [Planctomycetes bacterium]|nr:hypothetical protein [Planctomycetota bacterium]